MPAGRRVRHQHAAHRDLLEIWQYTCRSWSVEQADEYLTEIDSVIQRIAAGDIVGKRHEYQYRKQRVGAHVVFYRENDREIVIVRILHNRMNVGRHLAN